MMMRSTLADLGRRWDEMVDATVTIQTDLLRRTAAEMAEALDHAARQDVEGATEWRDLAPKEHRYATVHS